jgi:hypothetical protein
MSWTDHGAVNTIKGLAREFKVETYIETGTFRGQGIQIAARYFKHAYSCEIIEDFYTDVVLRTINKHNIKIFHMDSSKFLKYISTTLNEPLIYYLDAHFYDPSLPKELRFVVKQELASMAPSNNCIIIIHDFDTRNGLGHITYDGIPLDFEIVRDNLLKINPRFSFYTNYKEACDIVTEKDFIDGKMDPLLLDDEMRDTLKFIWSAPQKTYRGLLYCIPRDVNASKYHLRKVNWR